MQHKPHVLILGADGMLGHNVYAYLQRVFPNCVWGTSRQNSQQTPFHYLSVATFQRDLEHIYSKIIHIEYIVNCIGLLKGTKEEEFFMVNARFPKQLARYTAERKTRLLHISTDGVFDQLCGVVNEQSSPQPVGLYAKSKLDGESDVPNTLIIRTSVLGNDPIHHSGLLEYILCTPSPLQGFRNQLWSGCTTTQFAKLCERLIAKNLFQELRSKTNILHFSPIRHVSKYEILLSYISLLSLNKSVIPQSSPVITRQLVSQFDKSIPLSLFASDIKSALQEHIDFERIPV